MTGINNVLTAYVCRQYNLSMKILDLYCGAGGAAMGMHEALVEAGISHCIVGVDIEDRPTYPCNFFKGDVFELLPETLTKYDFIWASPPCQCYSVGGNKARMQGKVYPDLVAKTRELLEASGRPYIIENVPQAPIRKDVMLCGTMFGLKVFRHRHFECKGFVPEQPEHKYHDGRVGSHYQPYSPINGYVTCAGGGGGEPIAVWQQAMGIFHTTSRHEIAEAVPPAYSKYLLKQFLKTQDCGRAI